MNENIIRQYLQDQGIAKDFSIYYDLLQKYKSDYQVDKILSGKVPKEIKARAVAAKLVDLYSL